jgi:hypothetical protein
MYLVRLSANHVQEGLEIEGFGHELDGLALKDAGLVFAADGDDSAGAVGFGESHAVMDELEAVHDGHAEVGEEDIEALGEEIAQTFFAVSRSNDFGAGLSNQAAHRQSRGRVIFDDENARSLREGHAGLSVGQGGRKHVPSKTKSSPHGTIKPGA